MSRLRPADHLAVERVEDVVYAARLPEGPIYVLGGAAAAIWDAAVGDYRSVVPRVAARVGRAELDIEADVLATLGALTDAGLLMVED